MQRRNSVPGQLGLIPLRPRGKPQFLLKLHRKPPIPLWLPEGSIRQPRQLFKLSDLVVVMTLFLAILACTCSAYIFGQTSVLAARVPAAAQAYRPTFKRNYLPTLTPTSISPQLSNPLPPAAPVDPVPVFSASADTAATPVAGAGEAPFNLGTFSPGGGNSSLPLATANIPTFSTAAAATATLTPLPVYLPTQASGGSGYKLPTPAPSPTPNPTSAPTPTATPTPNTGWSFVSVRIYPGQDNGLLLYGNLINQTSDPQQLEDVGGTFYDEQGQVIAGEESTYPNWPINVVAPGQSVPFELFVYEITQAANFNLSVQAEPSGDAPHQDFEFADLKQKTEDGDYCVEGAVRNKGGELEDYLVVVAILYDGQDKVINYSDYQEFDLDGVVDGEAAEFEICVGSPNQDVARYELRAWGR